MAEKIWTDAQSSFINAKGGPILVSAAAGSGKTSAIVERVICRLCDSQDPLSADKLLMTTFSNAAATEMKSRIEKVLFDLSENQPDNLFLAEQCERINEAQIGTIHSFCLKIIRENFAYLNLNCDFKIADESENEILMFSAADAVMKKAYAENDPIFYELIENVCSSRNDFELPQIIIKIYRTIIAMPFPLDVLDTWEKRFNPTEQNYAILISPLINRALKSVRHAIEVCKRNIDEISNPKLSEFILDDLSALTECENFLNNGDISSASDILKNVKLSNRSLSSKLDPDVKAFVKLCRENTRKSLEQSYGLLCDVSFERYRDEQIILLPIVSKLFSLVRDFLYEFSSAKREKNLVDFNDAEQLMLDLLWQKQDDTYQKTDLALELANKFDEIYIDEYQDVNAAQEMIFKAIEPNSKNVFMVGDVKQSIYGFRQADADIFEEKKQSFNDFDGKSFPAKIFFDNNFRSRKSVTDFINEVFFRIMIDGVDAGVYSAGDSLKASATFEETQNNGVALLFYEAPKSSREKTWLELEAKIIAEQIDDMVKSGYQVSDGSGLRRARYSDFCILSRSDAGRFAAYSDALKQKGIDCVVDKSGSDFLESREMLLLLSILKAIDNPYDDISLCASMLSPIFLFTPSDLAQLRSGRDNRKTQLYSSVKAAAENGNQKCLKFLEKLSEFRRLAAGQSVDSLLSVLYDRYGIYYLVGAMNGGEERMNNLDIFRFYARRFEEGGYRGLGEFLKYIDKTQNNKNKLRGAQSFSENRNAVSIMTAHKSKGLEFPICILANSVKAFNQIDTNSNILLSKENGFACRITDSEKTVRYSTVSYKAAKLSIEQKQIAEEMRLLYVTLTRAKEKLIIPFVRTNIDKLINDAIVARQIEGSCAPVLNSKSWAEWFMYSCVKSTYMKKALLEYAVSSECTDSFVFDVHTPNLTTHEDKPKIQNRPDANLQTIELITEHSQFKYPFDEQSKIASKFSVSELSKGAQAVYDFESTPDFMQKDSISGAERGTALHTFMQFADYNRARESITAELCRIEDLGLITKRQREAINTEKLKIFFSSSLCDRILKADEVLREYKFMTGLDSSQFGGIESAKDSVILQGIADCVIIENSKAYIIDYKTDFVKSENELIDRYAMQLSLYKEAIEKLLGLKVFGCIIYSFCLAKEISVDV